MGDNEVEDKKISSIKKKQLYDFWRHILYTIQEKSCVAIVDQTDFNTTSFRSDKI